MTLKVRKQDVAAFAEWLGEHGLTPGTIDVYVKDLEKAAEQGGFLERLRSDGLAPKTKRHYLAAARHWAEYSDDKKLAAALKRLRLPPPRRKAAKVPIEREQMFAVVDEIGRADYLAPHMRSTLMIMACRGLRCGDVLRLQKSEIVEALKVGTLSFEAKGRRRLEFKLIKTYRDALAQLAKIDGDWVRVDELVSPHSANAKARRKAAARAVERALTRVGVKAGVFGLYPHRLRRTYAVEYLRQLKGDPEAVIKLQQHMQWASVATALEYVDHQRGDELDTFAEKIFER